MSDFGKIVRDILNQNGCVFVRHGKGDHDIWYSPITNRNITVDSKINIINKKETEYDYGCEIY